jgi:hypothetical protein
LTHFLDTNRYSLRWKMLQHPWSGSPGLVVPIGSELIAVFEFTIENGAIAEIALTSDAKDQSDGAGILS